MSKPGHRLKINVVGATSNNTHYLNTIFATNVIFYSEFIIRRVGRDEALNDS